MKSHTVLLACALGAASLLGAVAPASAAHVVSVHTVRTTTTGRLIPGNGYVTGYRTYGYRYGYGYPYRYGYAAYPYGFGVGIGVGYGYGGPGYGYVGAGYGYAPYPAAYAPPVYVVRRRYWRPYRRVYWGPVPR